MNGIGSIEAHAARPWTALALVALAWLPAVSARADVRLPALIGDNMVIQRDEPVHVWGWASPGERIAVELAGRRGSR